MITSKKSVGYRKGKPFVQNRCLIPALNRSTLDKWILSNDNVSFTFLENKETGVHLEKWSGFTFEQEVYNKSKALWQLNIITDYKQKIDSSSMFISRYDIGPSFVNFIKPSILPVTTATGTKVFVFRWNGVTYDVKNPTFTVNVTVTASLPLDGKHLDLQVKVSANQTYPSTYLNIDNAVVISAVHMPSLVFAKDSSDEVNNNTIFSFPVGWGHTVENPVLNLSSPRFAEESFHYDPDGHRIYHAGQPLGYSPLVSTHRSNYGNPGFMTVPALIYGRRDIEEGTLIYLMDTEGTNAKGFQWYSDDRNLHLNMYNVSDHEVDPYGVGGRHNPTVGFNTVNALRFSLRIRPFTAPTRWVDWYGYKLYKEEAVPEQQGYGWLPQSFYDRYINNEISLATSEIPAIINSFGFTTGTTESIVPAATFYQDLYKESVNPNITYNPVVPIHIQPINLNYAPNRVTGQYDVTGNYFGWEPWAGGSVGVNYGPNGFKSPDFTGVNNNYTGAYAKMHATGQLGYSYLAFPFALSTGSTWVQTYSGIDLCTKTLYNTNVTLNNNDYSLFARSGSNLSNFRTCFAPSISYDKFLDIADVVTSKGVGAYHDTLGTWGQGCYAHSHTYTDSNGNSVHLTHPRSSFSQYHIKNQISWLSGWYNVARTNIPSDWDNGTGDLGYLFNQSSEYPCDVQLKYVPTSLMYEAPAPILQTFYNKISDPRPDMLYNSYLGTIIDTLDDSSISTLLSVAPTLEYWVGLCSPPRWLQRCPAYQIVHSDKALLNEWITPHTTNANNLYYTKGVVTGIGTYGQILTDTNTESHRVMDWGSWSAIQWGYLNRLSTWHASTQYTLYDPTFTGFTDDQEQMSYSGLWSGHTTNLIERLFRLQAYNPDYIYHGTIEHPLNDWSGNISKQHTVSYGFKTSWHANVLTGDDYLGDYRIVHSVKKHRDKNNYLLTLVNWFSGQESFSGNFSPLDYNITDSYQVYSLDVSTASHGTRTLERIVPANTDYIITDSLDQFDTKVYEFVVNNEVLENTIFADLKTNYSYIRYSYGQDEITTNSIVLSYSYGSSLYTEISPAFNGFKAASTQQILNNVPQWMEARQNYNSNAWKLVNSWAMGLENVVENTYRNIESISLNTSDLTTLSNLSYVDIKSKEILQAKRFRNLLFNSSFSIRDCARYKLPAGWENYNLEDQDFTLDYNSASPGVVALASSTGIFKIGQQIIVNNTLINKTFTSIYIRSNATNVDITSYISVELMNGKSISGYAKLTNRSTEWVRLVLPLQINDQVYRINYSITSNSSGPVYIAAPQIETEMLTNWSNSINDSLPYYNNAPRFNAVFAVPEESTLKKVPIFQITDQTDFLDAALPTRIEKSIAPYKDLAPYATQAYGRKVTELSEVVRTEWAIVEEQIVERSVSPTAWDIYGRFDIKDLRFFEDLVYGTRDNTLLTITPIASAIHRDLLFVLCKEEYLNKTYRTLKIMKPIAPPNGATYIESITDFDLDLNFDIDLGLNQLADEEVSSIGFSELDPSWLIINTTANVRYYYRVYYDYYYFNSLSNRLYTLEKYNNAKIAVI